MAWITHKYISTHMLLAYQTRWRRIIRLCTRACVRLVVVAGSVDNGISSSCCSVLRQKRRQQQQHWKRPRINHLGSPRSRTSRSLWHHNISVCCLCVYAPSIELNHSATRARHPFFPHIPSPPKAHLRIYLFSTHRARQGGRTERARARIQELN